MERKMFEKVIGNGPIKESLFRIIDMMQSPDKYKRLGVNYPRGILLNGDPGLGKTLLATSFIEASGWKSFVCRKNRADGDFVDSIREIFSEAGKHTPAIVFLDDMDKFANEDYCHRNAEEYVTIQTCIDESKNLDLMVLATTNEKENLPDSLLRAGRFDLVIDMKCPAGEDAEKIIAYYLGQKKYVADLDVRGIADLLAGHSCAELETVINEAGLYAGFAGKDKIDKDDIIKASLRVIFNAEENPSDSDAYRMRIAVHEAGHAAAKELLEPGSVSLVTVRGHGDFGGVTICHQNEEMRYDKDIMEHKVMVGLAGRAATEIVYGVTDVGANADIHNALELVQRFVDDYCSRGFDKFEYQRFHSDNLLQRKEDLVFSEMERFYQQVKRLLIENRRFLEALAEELAEKRILLAEDIAAIRSQQCR